MKHFKLPFFIIKLVWYNSLNIISVIAFKLSGQRLLLLNVFLTLVAGVIGATWYFLPNTPSPTHSQLPLAFGESSEIKPIYQTLSQSDLQKIILKYEQYLTTKEFVSQNDYLNLASLYQANGDYQKAQDFLGTARQINPNREIFQ